MNLGTATAWDPSVHDGGVFALAVSGSTVYAGGSFTNVSKVAGSNPAVRSPATASRPSTPTASGTGSAT